MPQFRDDPHHPGTRVWRRSRWVTIGAGLATGFIGLIAIGLTAAAVVLVATLPPQTAMEAAAYLVMALVVVAGWGLAWLMWRDYQGKRFARIAIDDAGIALDLPRNRSLIHRPPAFQGRLAWSEIQRIDTREEAYLAQTMATLNRVSWLVRSDGTRILLYEERGLGTNLDQGNADELVDEIARRAKLDVTVLPVAEGKGGILSGWFAHPPPLDGAPLLESDIRRIRRRLIWTGAIGTIAFGLVFVLQALG